MEQQTIADTLRSYIRDRYSIAANDADFTDDVHLFDYGYIDSFGAVDLVNYVQSTFNIHVGETDLVAYPLNTINEISEFVTLRQRGEL